MPEEIISVQELSKKYRVSTRKPGLKASLKGLIKKEFVEVNAVKNVSFSIQPGEFVGFIGPNGAGKTTTLKMLSGLLHPTSGEVKVLGYIPWKRDKNYLSRISMVLGNKSQMLWDIPATDTFQVLAEIYRVPRKLYKDRIDELVELLDMEDILDKPVRNLSLGERMKCELTAGLIHQPDVMYLDEPTFGLDVTMQARLRKFLKTYNEVRGVTIILTSHYLTDVLTLCPRVILIHKGDILYDGDLKKHAMQLAPFKLIKIEFENGSMIDTFDVQLSPGVEIIDKSDAYITIRVNRNEVSKIASSLLNSLPIADLSIENLPIEAVIDQVYQEGEL